MSIARVAVVREVKARVLSFAAPMTPVYAGAS